MQISTTPISLQIPEVTDTTHNTHIPLAIVEPKTPEPTVGTNDKHDVTNTNSPWTRFNVQSSGMKV